MASEGGQAVRRAEKIPRAVEDALLRRGMDEAQLKAWINRERQLHVAAEMPASLSFEAWLGVKLRCKLGDADRIVRWSERW
jgi:hypothetical protein